MASKQPSKGTRQQRRRYTAEQRAAVVRDARQLGVVGAAKQHGVPQSCVSRWASQARRGKQPRSRRPGSAPGQRPAARRVSVARRAARAAAAEPPQARAPEATGASTVAASRETGQAGRRRTARAYTPSQRALIVEYAAREGVTAASEKYGASRFTIYDWQRKVAKAAVGDGESPTGGPAQSEVEEQRDREILAEWHRHPGLGPSQIKNQLRRRGVKVSVHTTRRVMEEAGYRPPKVKREPHDERWESVRPNHCWHLDFVHRHINRANTFTLILIDDYSRFVVGHGVEEAERADLVLEVFEEAVRRHGRPEMVMHDKGSAFWSWRGISRFTALLTELGIDQIAAEYKEWNGKAEVFNANLHKELFDRQRFYDVAEMRRRLTAHLSWYNEARTHHALGGLLVPADRYYGRVEQVLARIEAGAGRDPAAGVELRDRCLELFKVTSRAGVPEVWLLGQKLLGGPVPGAGSMPATRPSSAS
ncbi:MAG: DDE-type integrase/transposase/recombinase [Polyangiaceae bacterium]|nr:DDE-type integrase/transposase/recombinase [Polyangiaceae bacterium]